MSIQSKGTKMPWNQKTFGAVCAALRDSAVNGEFVPHVWADRVDVNDTGGCTFYGCGWGIVGWVTAVMLGGKDWATRAVPIGCSQGSVNSVMWQAGLTPSEISYMDPVNTWQYFDDKLSKAYSNRHADWDTFVDTSTELAEFFILVISRVPVDGSTETSHLPYNVLTVTSSEVDLQLFSFFQIDPDPGGHHVQESALAAG
jgi:hypothetical protein